MAQMKGKMRKPSSMYSGPTAPRDLEENEEDERHQGQLAVAAGPRLGSDSFMAAASVLRQGISGGVLLLGVPLDSDFEMGVASHAVADRESRRGANRGSATTNRERN
jgi:hypothetical protein